VVASGQRFWLRLSHSGKAPFVDQMFASGDFDEHGTVASASDRTDELLTLMMFVALKRFFYFSRSQSLEIIKPHYINKLNEFKPKF
jgi:hypothetical protein